MKSATAPPPISKAAGLVRFDEVLERVERRVIIDDETEYARVGVRWYGQGAFVRDRTLGAGIARKQQWIIRAGDVVYNKLFAWKGAFAVADVDVDGFLVSDKFPTYALDTSRVDPQYFTYYLRTSHVAAEAERLSKGAAAISKLTLNPPQFWELTMPLPTLDEQRDIAERIAGTLRTVEAAQARRREADAEAAALTSSHAKAIIERSAHEVGTLRDLVDIRGGGTPQKGDPRYWGGDIPWISPKDMKRRELSDSIDHITVEAAQETSARLLNAGCVLVVTRGMILAHTVPAAVLRVPAAINQDMKALIPSAAVTAEYLCAVLWAYNAELVDLVERSTHDTRKLVTDTLLDFKIPLPRADDQQRVLNDLTRAHSKHVAVEHLQRAVGQSLDALVAAVIHDIFSSLRRAASTAAAH